MEFLKKYDFTEEQIINLECTYNKGIINFIVHNSDIIEEKMDYLQQENFALLYDILYNNVKIFLENISVLQEKVNKMKEQQLSQKAMNMILIEEELYDKIN